MSLYVGINNSPKAITSLLIGKDGGATEAQSAYTGGVNSKSLVYSSKIDIDKELTKVNPIKALTSGEFTKDDIGKTVYLSNSKYACQEWRIADINHDGAFGTVDLFPKYLIASHAMVYNYNTNGIPYYTKSELRSDLNGNYYSGFADNIQDKIMYQIYTTDDSTICDKIKCPSLNEVGLNYDYSRVEGSMYPIFGDSVLATNALAIYKYCETDSNTNPSNTMYWTRSRSLYNSDSVLCVNPKGQVSSYKPNVGIISSIACIRFGTALAQSLSEADPINALTSGQITKDYIGFPVYLSNNAIRCQEWRIADINHDGVDGTIDLFPSYIFSNYSLATSGFTDDCSARSFLNNTVYKGFSSDVKSAIIEQNNIQYDSNNEGLSSHNDMIKMPSVIELGLGYDNDDLKKEGSLYPLFGKQEISGTNALAKRQLLRDTNQHTDYASYWTRSSNYYYPMYITENGVRNSGYSNNSHGILGIIRIKTK